MTDIEAAFIAVFIESMIFLFFANPQAKYPLKTSPAAVVSIVLTFEVDKN